MPNQQADVSGMSTGALVREIGQDLRTLVEKEVASMRLEVRDALASTRSVLVLGAIALGGAVAATFALTAMLAQLLRRHAGLSEWVSYGLVALGFAVVAAVVALLAKRRLREVRFIPRRALHEARQDMRMLEDDVRSSPSMGASTARTLRRTH
jgi:hypothetical protein